MVVVPEVAMLRKLSLAFAFASIVVGQERAPEPGKAPRSGAAVKRTQPAPKLNDTVRFTKESIHDVDPLEVDAATKAGLAALLKLQEGEGHDEWPYEGVYREDNGILPVGYRIGGTAIVCLSLIAAPGYAADAPRQEALARGVAFILSALELPRMQADFVGTYDVRGWGHIYALHLFLELQEHKWTPVAHQGAVAAKAKWLVQTLCESAIPESGGWNYSRPAGYTSPKNRASTFMTAPALQVLFLAKARGHAVADAVLDQAVAALERARSEPGGYGYGAALTSQNEVPESKLAFMDKVPSSAARATACETTLMLAGHGDKERLHRAVERFFADWDELAVRKSQLGTHIQPYGIAPYYFLYGHLYAAQAIEQLDDGAEKEALRTKMRAYLARSRDADGSWNDRQFARSAGYGTALALLCLHMPHLPKPEPRSALGTKKV